jgi:hypothetical protein
METFREDDRALAVGILLFMASIILAALLFIMMDPVIADIKSTSLSQTDNQQATEVINERAKIWGVILFFPIFASGVFIIARATFESRGP